MCIIHHATHQNFVENQCPHLAELGYENITVYVYDSTETASVHFKNFEVLILLSFESCLKYVKFLYKVLNDAKADNSLKMVIHSDMQDKDILGILNEQERKNKWIIEKISLQNGELQRSLESFVSKGMQLTVDS